MPKRDRPPLLPKRIAKALTAVPIMPVLACPYCRETKLRVCGIATGPCDRTAGALDVDVAIRCLACERDASLVVSSCLGPVSLSWRMPDGTQQGAMYVPLPVG